MTDISLNYPLYDSLRTSSRAIKNINLDIRKVCRTVMDMSKQVDGNEVEHYEVIYSLILYHNFLENRGTIFSLTPYQIKQIRGGRGVTIAFPSLPIILQRIITQYIHECSSS